MKFNLIKKSVVASIFILSTIICFSIEAQWVEQYYVDEFGDKTDQKYESLIAQGTFSNSATTNSKATYSFIKDTESLLINVYEYGSSLATSIDPTFETVKIKQPSGNVVTIERVFFTKSGKLFFSKDNFTELLNTIQESGEYRMIFNRTGEYSQSSYNIKFKL